MSTAVERALDEFETYIRRRIEDDRASHREVSDELQTLSSSGPIQSQRGFSVRSIQRFCHEKGIHKTSRLSAAAVEHVVSEAVEKVGPSYGRKTMTGLLAAGGIRVSVRRVGRALQEVNPSYQSARGSRANRRFNPVPYHASYFGQKLHIDQNEKLVMFGVTHICAIDGFSGKIVGFVSMPIKNNVEIYHHLFRPITLEHGVWDQVRVDQGKEWILTLYMQEQLAHLRHDISKPPHRQTTSKLNHTVERIWPEVNQRVNYPIKECLVAMDANNEFDLDAPAHKFCISWVTLRVASVGTALLVHSWNEHPIPGKGVPNQLAVRSRHIGTVPPLSVLTSADATQAFQELGGNLTLFSPFGVDPLDGRQDLSTARETEFYHHVPDFSPLFHSLVNGNSQPFRSGLKLFIDLTDRLTPLS